MEEYITHKKQIPKVEFVDSNKSHSTIKSNVIVKHSHQDVESDGGGEESRVDITEHSNEIDEDDEQQLEEHEEVIDMYEDRDIISEMFTPGLQSSNQDHSHQQEEEEQHSLIESHSQQNQQMHSDNSNNEEQNIEIASVSTYGLDPDERFLLSCAPILKRLSHKKNAMARLKMQQILYEIEFGEAMF